MGCEREILYDISKLGCVRIYQSCPADAYERLEEKRKIKKINAALKASSSLIFHITLFVSPSPVKSMATII